MEENKEIVKIDRDSSFITPVADINDALDRYKAFGDFVSKILKSGTDYGEIPGTSKKTLLKPGAEKLGAFFGLRPVFVLQESVNDWTGKEHNGEPFFFREYKSQLFRNGELIGEGIGSCNSWEKKYRYRKQNRLCPICGSDAIIKGKAEYGGGWICYAKKGGCGAKFDDNNEAIIKQTAGMIPNPDVADQVNTIDKMAQKRAFVAAILIATNASDYFTQDMEDFSGDDVIEASFREAEEKPERKHQKASRPLSPEDLKAMIEKKAEIYGERRTSVEQRGLLVSMLEVCYAGDDAEMKRHEVLQYLTGESSSKKLGGQFVQSILDWLKPKQDDGGQWQPDPMAVREAQTLLTAARKEAGQEELFEEANK